jgi:hypothetical protein
MWCRDVHASERVQHALASEIHSRLREPSVSTWWPDGDGAGGEWER